MVRNWPCHAVSARRKFRNPGPAIETSAIESVGGSASTSACASARGLDLAGRAISIAMLQEKSPWLRSFGRSTTKSGTTRSVGSVPCARRLSMPWSIRRRTRARSWVFTGIGGVLNGPALYALHPAAGRQRHRRAVADDEVVEQADVDQGQGLLEAGGDGAVG